MTALSEIRVGGSGVLEKLDLPEEISDHLAHLGFLPGASFEVLRRAPAGDPTVYRIDGIEVGLRRETASHILAEDAAGFTAAGFTAAASGLFSRKKLGKKHSTRA